MTSTRAKLERTVMSNRREADGGRGSLELEVEVRVEVGIDQVSC